MMNMASRRSFAILRRSLSARSYHVSALRHGAHMTPPLPAFARIPVKSEPLPENYDALWDDGVAPELALDFDAPHISSSEALWSAAGAFSIFFALYQFIKVVAPEDANPALGHEVDVIIPDDLKKWLSDEVPPKEE